MLGTKIFHAVVVRGLCPLPRYGCCWSCSPPAVECALSEGCLLSSAGLGHLEKGCPPLLKDCLTRLFYPSWNRMYRFTAYRLQCCRLPSTGLTPMWYTVVLIELHEGPQKRKLVFPLGHAIFYNITTVPTIWYDILAKCECICNNIKNRTYSGLSGLDGFKVSKLHNPNPVLTWLDILKYWNICKYSRQKRLLETQNICPQIVGIKHKTLPIAASCIRNWWKISTIQFSWNAHLQVMGKGCQNISPWIYFEQSAKHILQHNNTKYRNADNVTVFIDFCFKASDIFMLGPIWF